jgi:3-methyladenine DNA glycosylase AlkC
VAARQIEGALPPPLDPTLTDNDFGDFIFAPFGKYVEDHGADHYLTSMALLRELTMRMSMEGPVRPFIDLRPDETLRLFENWARDDSYHVRRLVSESTRPLLPWAPRISLDVADPIPLLDILHADPTRYVTRSVANHLNDISRIDPRLTIDSLTRWQSEERQTPDELEWMTQHALRTLIKRGDPVAMRLLGYSNEPRMTVGRIDIGTPVVSAGEALRFSIEVTAVETERLLVDYSIDFVRKGGKTSPRVFKLKKLSL